MTDKKINSNPGPGDDYDEALVNDFRDEFQDAYDSIKNILIGLESRPRDEEGLHALFRSMHSIKSNLRMMSLNSVSEFVHGLENTLEDMRKGQLQFDNRMSDIFLLSLESVREVFEKIFAGNPAADRDLNELQSVLENIRAGNPELSQHMRQALALLDSDYAKTSAGGANLLTDLDFFHKLADFIDDRTAYRKDSSERQLGMALEMNTLAGEPVNPEQLQAAVYIHDIGMAFLQLELLHKKGKYTQEERHWMEQHPILGANLLQRLSIWSEASRMVRQHHERFDGQGYPDHLSGEEISDGARILAIIDTFESMTHERADRDHRRPILRVVAEINANSEKQFDPKWVDVFNQMIRKRYSKPG